MIKLTKNKLMIAIAITLVAVILNKQILEGFRQGRRFFWGYNPTSRNSSYDIRGDKNERNQYRPKETGIFYESGLYQNFQDI